MKVLQLRPGSDAFEAAISGLVKAERIKAVIASTTSKRHREYFQHISRQYHDARRAKSEGRVYRPEHDPNDRWRYDEDHLAMIGRTLRQYRDKHGLDDPANGKLVKAGLIYLHDELPVCACPHGIDSNTILLTVRVREKPETFEREIGRDVMPDAFRVMQAQMAITGHGWAIEVNSFMDDTGTLLLYEKDAVPYDKCRGDELLEAMATFAAKTREMEAA